MRWGSAGRRRSQSARILTVLRLLLGEVRRARRTRRLPLTLVLLPLLLPLAYRLLALLLLAHLIRPPELLLSPLLLDPLALILAQAGVQALVHRSALPHHAPDLLHEGLAGGRIPRAPHLPAQSVDLVVRPPLGRALVGARAGWRILRAGRRGDPRRQRRRDGEHRDGNGQDGSHGRRC